MKLFTVVENSKLYFMSESVDELQETPTQTPIYAQHFNKIGFSG